MKIAREILWLVALLVCGTALVATPKLGEAGPSILSRGGSSDAEGAGGEPGETVGVSEAPQAEVYQERAVDRGNRWNMEVGLRFGAFTAGDDWVDSDGSADYGGLGFLFRWRFARDWALELGTDMFFRSAESQSLSESRYLGTLGIQYYFGEWSEWLQFRAGMGFNGGETWIESDWADSGSYSEAGLYASVGMDLLLGNWTINSDVRVLGLWRTTSLWGETNHDYYRWAPESRGAVMWTVGTTFGF